MSNGSLISAWRQRWNRNLFQFLRRRVTTKVDIEDLAQETYLRLLRARDLGEVRHPQAYLLRVATHVVLEWRDQQPRPEMMTSLTDDLVTDELTPELELDKGLSRQRLEDALATVSPLIRAVLLLKLREDWSSNAIAAELNLTPRQVKRYLARGYERLRVELEN